ncbi:MAG: hypothetical protein ACRC78_19430 [Planktothrix sp.]
MKTCVFIIPQFSHRIQGIIDKMGFKPRTYAQDQRNRVSGPDFADEIEISRSETRFLRKS